MAPPTDRPSFPPAVLEALRKGNKLEALKLLRAASKAGLAEAKAAVDALQAGTAAAPKPVRAKSVGATEVKVAAPIPGYVPHSRSGLSPGEVPRGGAQVWWVLVLVLGAVALFALGWPISQGE